MKTQEETPTKAPDRSCYFCSYWYPGRVALTTDTPGACLCMGSPFEMPRATDTCQMWEQHT